MAKRYADLTKVPPDPVVRLLAVSGLELATEIEAPASAATERVLYALDDKAAWVDIIKLLSVALPAREAVWWACLAARDYIAAHPKTHNDCVKAAEAWVFEPGSKTRATVETALQNASPKDKTALCATAALYGGGTMGTGEMAKLAAPPSAVAGAVFGMNLLAMGDAEDPDEHLQLLIDRGLDIARGGNGRVERPAAGDAAPGAELAPAKGES